MQYGKKMDLLTGVDYYTGGLTWFYMMSFLNKEIYTPLYIYIFISFLHPLAGLSQVREKSGKKYFFKVGESQGILR